MNLNIPKRQLPPNLHHRQGVQFAVCEHVFYHFVFVGGIAVNVLVPVKGGCFAFVDVLEIVI